MQAAPPQLSRSQPNTGNKAQAIFQLRGTFATQDPNGSYHNSGAQRLRVLGALLWAIGELNVTSYLLTAEGDIATISGDLVRWGLVRHFVGWNGKPRILVAEPGGEGHCVMTNLNIHECPVTAALYIDIAEDACQRVAKMNPGIMIHKGGLAEDDCRAIIDRFYIVSMSTRMSGRDSEYSNTYTSPSCSRSTLAHSGRNNGQEDQRTSDEESTTKTLLGGSLSKLRDSESPPSGCAGTTDDARIALKPCRPFVVAQGDSRGEATAKQAGVAPRQGEESSRRSIGNPELRAQLSAAYVRTRAVDEASARRAPKEVAAEEETTFGQKLAEARNVAEVAKLAQARNATARRAIQAAAKTGEEVVAEKAAAAEEEEEEEVLLEERVAAERTANDANAGAVTAVEQAGEAAENAIWAADRPPIAARMLDVNDKRNETERYEHVAITHENCSLWGPGILSAASVPAPSLARTVAQGPSSTSTPPELFGVTSREVARGLNIPEAVVPQTVRGHLVANTGSQNEAQRYVECPPRPLKQSSVSWNPISGNGSMRENVQAEMPCLAIFDFDNTLTQAMVFNELCAAFGGVFPPTGAMAQKMPSEWWIKAFGGQERIGVLDSMLGALRTMSVKCCICSMNVTEVIIEGLLRVCLLRHFVESEGTVLIIPQGIPPMNKGMRVRQQLGNDVRTERALFVDDDRGHIMNVGELNPGISVVNCSTQGLSGVECQAIVAHFQKMLA